MLLHHAPVSPPQADAKMLRVGVGIDTSRYGHYAAFLRDDLQPAAGELQFIESAAGYAQLRSRFEQIVRKLGTVHFVVRVDVAGQLWRQDRREIREGDEIGRHYRRGAERDRFRQGRDGGDCAGDRDNKPAWQAFARTISHG